HRPQLALQRALLDKGRDEQHLEVWTQGQKLRGQLQAAHAGHHHIDEDQVDDAFVRAAELERVLATGRKQHVIPLVLEGCAVQVAVVFGVVRSEEHTSELQSLAYLVCRLLLEKKKKNINKTDLRSAPLRARTLCA